MTDGSQQSLQGGDTKRPEENDENKNSPQKPDGNLSINDPATSISTPESTSTPSSPSLSSSPSKSTSPQTPTNTQSTPQNVNTKDGSSESSPPSPSPSPPSTPSSSEKKHTPLAAAPPKWRFVSDAKKSAGYSSLAAGRHVAGKSADELGAKYIPPDISLYNKKPEKEQEEVGKLLIREWKREEEEEVIDGDFPGLPVFQPSEEESKTNFKEWDVNIELGPKKERETEWFDGEVHDNYRVGDEDPSEKKTRDIGKLSIPSMNFEKDIFTGEYVLRRRKSIGEEDESKENRDSATPIISSNEIKDEEIQSTSSTIHEEEGSSNSNPPTEEVAIIPNNNADVKTPRQKRKERCLYLLLFLLLLMVVILGVLLGKKSKNSGNGGADAALHAVVIVPPLKNDTIMPSSAPSSVLKHGSSLQPTFSTTTTTTTIIVSSTLDNSERPSLAPSLSPSLKKSGKPSPISSNVPSDFPSLSSTNVPSKSSSTIPSESPTNSPFKNPTSKPSILPSYIPSYNPTQQCSTSNNTSIFSIDYLEHNIQSAETTNSWYPATWKIREICSGEVIRECLPCSLGTLVLTSVGKKKRKKRMGGYTRALERELIPITECLPSNGEYLFEVYPTYGSGCCGFDPTIYTASYENVVFMKGYLATDAPGENQDDGNGDKYNVHDGSFGTGDPCPTQKPSLPPTSAPSNFPSKQPTTMPSVSPSSLPSVAPSSFPSIHPSLGPTTRAPTKSPIVGIGGCPKKYTQMSYYEIGDRVEVNGIVYECTSYACGTYGFDPGVDGSSLWRQAWNIVGQCTGTIPPTLSPTTTKPTSMPSSAPTHVPTRLPTSKPSFKPTNSPTPLPTQPLPTSSPTCESENDFNLCIALDMSGSVCNSGSLFGNECYGCSPSMFCQDFFYSKNTCCRNFEAEVIFTQAVVSSLGELSTDKSFSIVQFGDWAVLASGLSSTEQTLSSLNWLDYSGGATNHADAIRLCQETLTSSPFPDRKNFIIMITDGLSTLPEGDPKGSALSAAEEAKDAGTYVMPVFISTTYEADTIGFMSELSSENEVFDVSDFESLNSLGDRLVNEISCQS